MHGAVPGLTPLEENSTTMSLRAGSVCAESLSSPFGKLAESVLLKQTESVVPNPAGSIRARDLS